MVWEEVGSSLGIYNYNYLICRNFRADKFSRTLSLDFRMDLLAQRKLFATTFF